VNDRTGLWLWPILATLRLRAAIRQHWKRILLGAFVGWIFAVVGGAFALASLEFHRVIGETTSDELGIVLVLYGVGIGALNAYALRPAHAECSSTASD
jgi:NADH:ubiquinone oxidoreductase subunit 5 (subunit L)/multisubunit Na+/H+ antiporter MnhA subunit